MWLGSSFEDSRAYMRMTHDVDANGFALVYCIPYGVSMAVMYLWQCCLYTLDGEGDVIHSHTGLWITCG